MIPDPLVNQCSPEPRQWETGDAVEFKVGYLRGEGTYHGRVTSWPAPNGYDENWSAVAVDVGQRRILVLPTADLEPNTRYCDARLAASWHDGGKVHCAAAPGHVDGNADYLHHATVDGQEIWWRPTDHLVARPSPDV